MHKKGLLTEEEFKKAKKITELRQIYLCKLVDKLEDRKIRSN